MQSSDLDLCILLALVPSVGCKSGKNDVLITQDAQSGKATTEWPENHQDEASDDNAAILLSANKTHAIVNEVMQIAR